MPPKTTIGMNIEAQLEHDLRVRQELRDILLIKARSSFYTFVQLMAPVIIPGFIDGKHIKLVADTLEWAYRTDNARVMIFLPPGAMKSRLGSILFPAWVFGQRPDWQILHVGHSADFTASFGADIRDLMCLDEYKEIFPNLSLDENYQAREHWRTKQKGIYRSAGVGGAIAGKRGNFGICDDLISEQNADSKPENEKVHKWWPRGFESRILPKGKIVLINTRWNTFDPAGWLLDRAESNPTLSQWKVVKVPALLDKVAAKMLGGVEGESYWPEFYDTDTVKRMQTGMSRSHWLATYQQEPIALDGNIIKTEHFQDWGKNGKGEIEHVIASLDTAFSTSTHADHSVIQVWGVFNQRRVDSEGTERDIKCLVLLDQHRGKWEYPELIKHCQEVEDDHVPDTWLIEKKASGQSLIQDLRRRGYFVVEYSPDKDKLTRVISATPFIEDERIYVPMHLIWCQDFIDECQAFGGKKTDKDDQVDAMSQAVIWLRDSHYLNYEGEVSLEELEDERQTRVSKQRFYW